MRTFVVLYTTVVLQLLDLWQVSRVCKKKTFHSVKWKMLLIWVRLLCCKRRRVILPEVWEWMLVMTRSQFLNKAACLYCPCQTHHNHLWLWWREGKILAGFSNLSWLKLLLFRLCVIVRFWLQFSSQRRECDCGSRVGGQQGLPS